MKANPRGKSGEEFAAARLLELGYRLLERNWHCPYGEVDIIAVCGDEICFVEVKTRRRGAQVSAAQSVGLSKQRKIIKTALLYLQRHPDVDLQPRFDLFTVTTDGRGGVVSHDFMMGAFDGEAYSRGPVCD